jgi:hypothetical protein
MKASPMQISRALFNRHPGESPDPLNKRHAGGTDRAEGIYWAPAFAGVTGSVGVIGKAARAS